MKRRAAKRRPAPDKIINNLYEAKLNLSRLVERAAAGEEIIIAKNGKPMAKLVPLPPQKPRVPGGWEGKVWIADNFDDPLPDELLDLFEGRGDETSS
jgi:prevent-host-death family protein